MTPGFLSLGINLNSGGRTLLKVASSDTTFKLDSLKIILSAPGVTTTTYSYAISGRPDTGSITVSPKIFALASMRTWKARILTIDTTLNPIRTDTVHLDSVSFTINPGDTTKISKTLNAVFSILKVRFLSNSPASIASNVKYLRIRVDGAVRDSVGL